MTFSVPTFATATLIVLLASPSLAQRGDERQKIAAEPAVPIYEQIDQIVTGPVPSRVRNAVKPLSPGLTCETATWPRIPADCLTPSAPLKIKLSTIGDSTVGE